MKKDSMELITLIRQNEELISMYKLIITIKV